jgi:hypothetical protein
MIYPEGVPATTGFNDWLAIVYSFYMLVRPGKRYLTRVLLDQYYKKGFMRGGHGSQG